MQKFLAVLFALLTTAAVADDRADIVGTWKLVSFIVEFQDGRPPLAEYGQSPMGYTVFTPEGRAITIIEAEGRKPPTTDEERVQMFRTMFAYSGLYRFEGNKYVTKVDVSWNPGWDGTEQVRFYKLQGDRLDVVSDWLIVRPGAKPSRGVIAWQRVR
jgi:hypothetical protein